MKKKAGFVPWCAREALVPLRAFQSGICTAIIRVSRLLLYAAQPPFTCCLDWQPSHDSSRSKSSSATLPATTDLPCPLWLFATVPDWR